MCNLLRLTRETLAHGAVTGLPFPGVGGASSAGVAPMDVVGQQGHHHLTAPAGGVKAVSMLTATNNGGGGLGGSLSSWLGLGLSGAGGGDASGADDGVRRMARRATVRLCLLWVSMWWYLVTAPAFEEGFCGLSRMYLA